MCFFGAFFEWWAPPEKRSLSQRLNHRFAKRGVPLRLPPTLKFHHKNRTSCSKRASGCGGPAWGSDQARVGLPGLLDGTEGKATVWGRRRVVATACWQLPTRGKTGKIPSSFFAVRFFSPNCTPSPKKRILKEGGVHLEQVFGSASCAAKGDASIPSRRNRWPPTAEISPGPDEHDASNASQPHQPRVIVPGFGVGSEWFRLARRRAVTYSSSLNPQEAADPDFEHVSRAAAAAVERPRR